MRCVTLVMIMNLLWYTQASAGVTIITHGWTLGSDPGEWTSTMADAVIEAAGGGTSYMYDPATGEWVYEAEGARADGEIVLIFDWAEESDGFDALINWEFAEAAGDALYTAIAAPRMRDDAGDLLDPSPDLLAERMHFIGHSRGAVVTSYAIRLLGDRTEAEVDQFTSLDPHPVDGDLFGLIDWGDRTPRRWSNVEWGDNYYRVNSAFCICPFDFEGAELDSDEFVNLDFGSTLGDAFPEIDILTCDLEHIKVHVWYHGTIDTASDDDGTCDIDDDWYSDRDMEGFYYSQLGGGEDDRDLLGSGVDPLDSSEPLIQTVFNGDFEFGSIAGWFCHGGDTDQGVTDPGLTSGNEYATLSDEYDSMEHNRLIVESDHVELSFSYERTESSDVPEARLEVSLIDADGELELVTEVDLTVSDTAPTTHVAALPDGIAQPGAYTLEFALIDGGEIIIDDVALVSSEEPLFLRGDCNGNGTISTLPDALYLLNYSFADGPEPPCFDAADVDGNNTVLGLVDALYLLEYGFLDGEAPPDPGPSECGPDVDDDDVDCATPPAC